MFGAMSSSHYIAWHIVTGVALVSIFLYLKDKYFTNLIGLDCHLYLVEERH